MLPRRRIGADAHAFVTRQDGLLARSVASAPVTATVAFAAAAAAATTTPANASTVAGYATAADARDDMAGFGSDTSSVAALPSWARSPERNNRFYDVKQKRERSAFFEALDREEAEPRASRPASSAVVRQKQHADPPSCDSRSSGSASSVHVGKHVQPCGERATAVTMTRDDGHLRSDASLLQIPELAPQCTAPRVAAPTDASRPSQRASHSHGASCRSVVSATRAKANPGRESPPDRCAGPPLTALFLLGRAAPFAVAASKERSSNDEAGAVKLETTLHVDRGAAVNSSGACRQLVTQLVGPTADECTPLRRHEGNMRDVHVDDSHDALPAHVSSQSRRPREETEQDLVWALTRPTKPDSAVRGGATPTSAPHAKLNRSAESLTATLLA